MKRKIIAVAGLLLAPLLTSLVLGQSSSTPPAPPTYTLTDLGPMQISAAPSGATSVNNSGQVAGFRFDNTVGANQAFLWTGGTLSELGTLGGASSFGYGVNAGGVVVGASDLSTSGGNTQRAFSWLSGTMSNLGDSNLAGNYSSAFGINSHGEIAGYSNDGLFHPVVWNSGIASGGTVLTTLPCAVAVCQGEALAINDAGQAAGWSNATPSGSHAVVWSNTGQPTDLGTLGSLSNTQANAINNQGVAVGYSQLDPNVAPSTVHAFVWQSGDLQLQDLGTIPGPDPYVLGTVTDTNSSAWGINTKGDVVGISATGQNAVLFGSGGRAFLYSGGVTYDLTSLLAPGTNWRLEAAWAINDNGQIVGVGFNSSGVEHGFLLTPSAAPTATTLSPSVNPSVFGQQVSLTATVNPTSPSSLTPGGTVLFSDGLTTLGSVSISSGSAILNTSTLAVGGHSITASYSGDSNFASSTSDPLSLTVNQGTTTTAISASSSAGVFGQPITLTGTVTAGAPAFGTPGGTVTFMDGTAPLRAAMPLAGGQAILTTSSLIAGPHTLTAVYSGDGSFATSTSAPFAFSVSPTQPTIFWATPAGISYGTALSGTQLNATASVPGSFVYTPPATTALSAGSHTLSLTFTPTDTVDYTAANATVVIAVSQVTPAVVWPPPAPISFGTPLTSAQLNAAANVPGLFAYTPAFGAVLAVGTQTLSVVFTPADTVDYTNAVASVPLAVNPPLAITTGASTTFTEGAAGSFLVAASGTPTPSLVENGALPTGVTFVDNGNGTATLGGTPGSGTSGTYPLTFTAASAGSTVSQSFTLTVTSGPAITSGSTTTLTEQIAGSFTVTSTGSPTPAISETGALPVGIAFTDNGNGSATLAGIPAAGSSGNYPISLFANNGIGTGATQAFTLKVNAGAAITSGSSTTFTVGSTSFFTVTTKGLPIPALVETGTLPPGVTFGDNGDGTGTLGGSPASGSTGSYPVTFTATNGVGAPALQSFTLTVNQGPAITSGSSTSFTVGAPGSFLVLSNGFPTPALTETGPLPSGVTFVDNNNGTATLSGTPSATSGGAYPLTITAANGVDINATQSFSLTVDQGIAITSGSTTTFTAGTQGFFSVTTTGFPVASLTETGPLPTGVTFSDNGNGTATLAGIPAAASGGSYGFTIRASNGGVSPDATQSFTLSVNQGASILTGNATTFTVGAFGSFTVKTGGVPAPGIAETSPLPAGVTFADNLDGTGTLSGTPASGTGGTYPITFTADNGVDSPALQAFTLIVNQNPAITSSNIATFNEQVMGSFSVTTSGIPAPALSEVGNLPNGVAFIDNGDGTATLGGIPAAGSGGQYGFTITADNGLVPSATQTFTLTVVSAPSFTSPNTTTFVPGVPGSFTVTTSGSPTPTLTEGGALPSGVTFTDNQDGTATLAGTAAANSGGIYPLALTAHNGVAPDGTQTFTLTVAADKKAPVITWANPAPINQGDAIGSTQLNATANIPGTFLYSPAAGAILSLGLHTLSVTFTPTDRSTYATATATVQINVLGNAAFTVGGTISGLGIGKSVTLLDNGGNALKVVNGVPSSYPYFVFTQVLAAGAGYNVTVGVQPFGQLCTVFHGSGTVKGKVNTIVVNCQDAATIGGTVTGLLDGETLVLLNNGGNALTIRTAAGRRNSFPFVFSAALGDRATFDVTVGTQPLRQICTVTNGTGTVVGPIKVTGVVVDCGAGNTVGGTISGLGIDKSVTLLDNGGNALKVVNSGPRLTRPFVFTQVLAAGAGYNVTVGVQPLGQLCTVFHGSGTVQGKVNTIVVNCQNAATIGGTVTGLSAGQSLVLLNNGGNALTIRKPVGPGNSFPFVFSVALGDRATFDVTVGTQPLRQICTVTNGTGTVVGAVKVTGVVVDCGAGNTVGGTISGLGIGRSVTLLDSGGNALKVVNSGPRLTRPFVFTQVLAAGAGYNVTVGMQPFGQLCTVSHGSGTVQGKVNTIVVNCQNAATIGGTVNGLSAGQSLVLLNNGGNALTIRGASRLGSLLFEFSAALGDGATFDVTVGTQPLRQICTVTKGTGTVVGAKKVTDIVVDCR